MKPVNLRELSDSFQCLGCEEDSRFFVDKRDGQIHSFYKGHLALAGFFLDGDDYEAHPSEAAEIERAKKFVDNYDRDQVVDFPDKYEFSTYSIMEDYVSSQENPKVQDKLYYAMKGSRAFSRFRDAVTDLGLLDDWYAYKDHQFLEQTKLWCRVYGVDFEPKISEIDDFLIRPADIGELATLNRIYKSARQYMANNGNPLQWSGGYPAKELLISDIKSHQLYAVVSNGKICGAFAFIIGPDPTYADIEGGAWLNDKPYGTIHRIASDGSKPGIFKACLDFCLEFTKNVRIDTHKDNHIMQSLLQANLFAKCGTIYVQDGESDHSPRIAYHYDANDPKGTLIVKHSVI
jgi:hypothetical protein